MIRARRLLLPLLIATTAAPAERLAASPAGRAQTGSAEAAPVDRATPRALIRDVRIPSEQGVVLAGTLRLPGRGSGPFPLAVLIQGHGPNGRGGFTAVSDRLLADGIATLEYDKRGIGQSTGTYKEGIERLTVDATAAVRAMRGLAEIDGTRIALVGHSQGGVVGPAVAAADSGIAAVVTLAGSVGDGLPYLAGAIRGQMIRAGRPADAVDPAVDAVVALLQARIDGRDATRIAALRTVLVDRFVGAGFTRVEAEGALAMIDTEEAWEADKLRSASDLRALHRPVLAVFGSRDAQVIAAHEAPAARAALANNPAARVVVLDGLAHWFQEGAVTGSSAEFDRLGPNLGSPRVVALVGDWLRDVLSAEDGRAARPLR